MRKNHKRIILYTALSLAVAAGGFVVMNPQVAESFHTHSQCKFNPQMSDEVKSMIAETITTVANGSLLSLMGKKSRLVAMGDQISDQVTDFEYWGYVFSTPQLARDMKKIQGSSVKYKGFVKGTQNKLSRESKDNPCFFQEAGEFAEYLHLPKEDTLAVLQSCLAKSSSDKYAFKPYLDYLIAQVSQ